MGDGGGVSSPLPDHIFGGSDGEFGGKLLPNEGPLLGRGTPRVLRSSVQVVLINRDCL